MSATYDIAVVGSGAAGIVAAVCAARAGGQVLLLDQNAGPGGIGGFSGLTTLCGLYDDAGNFLNGGFTQEFAEAIGETAPVKSGRLWVLLYRPEKFRAVAAEFIGRHRDIETIWNSPVKDVVVEGGRVVALNGHQVGAVVDCTGTAEVARAAGAKCLETDETTQAPAVVFQLRGVTREIDSAAAAAQVLMPLIRAGFPPLYFHPNLGVGSITAKFSGGPDQVPALIEFLRANVRGFEKCEPAKSEFTISRRAGRMVVGEYVLTGADVLGAKKFPDAVARCSWPVEQWSTEGKTKLRWLPQGECYEIPARSLRAAGLPNLFMAGKTISADVEAIASARVMGCCLATGAAAARLAGGHR